MEDKVDRDIYSTITDVEDKPLPQSEEEKEEEEEEEQLALTKSRLYLVGLGILCALVAAAAVFMGIKSTALQESLDDLTTDTQNLMERRRELKEDIEHLIEERETGCDSCPVNWILYNNKCYLFYDKPARWKTWDESRRICWIRRSDLVVIDDLEEQKFVSKHIKYYFGKYHGYWMGLQEINKTWTWIDGRVDTLGFWTKPMDDPVGPKGLVLPELNPSESWKMAMNMFQNKFICERNVRKP